MKESIYTIPISEVFEEKVGCPICSLYNTLETRWVEYITGAAMMEPDIRIETNRQGFCNRHIRKMVEQRNKLSVALVLQSHLQEIQESLGNVKKEKIGFFANKSKVRLAPDCFVCDRIEREFSRIGDNIAVFWSKEHDFRKLYAEQEFLCYEHYKVLASAGANSLKGQEEKEFVKVTSELTSKKLKEAKNNIDAFCNLFDHRNAGNGKPSDEVAAAIDSAITYLGSK